MSARQGRDGAYQPARGAARQRGPEDTVSKVKGIRERGCTKLTAVEVESGHYTQ